MAEWLAKPGKMAATVRPSQRARFRQALSTAVPKSLQQV
jgi:hypothetical protein